MFAVYRPNGPDADPRPLSVIRAARGLEHVEDALERAKIQIEAAIDSVAVVLDTYDCCLEDDRRRAVGIAHEALMEMTAGIRRRLEDAANE